MAELQHIERVVGNTFLCNKCGQFMAPPIYQCVKGHIICNPCYARNKCNTCGEVKNDTVCHALEEIHSKIRFPCKNRGNGCAFFALWVQVKEHEQTCPLNEVEEYEGHPSPETQL